MLTDLENNNQIAIHYLKPTGTKAKDEYPYNPYGSIAVIAGICNQQGNVLGLMPHPEDHIFDFQNPNRRIRTQHSGLVLFQNGVNFSRQS
jgi:phosphoribosylformylglycinamidine synthase